MRILLGKGPAAEAVREKLKSLQMERKLDTLGETIEFFNTAVDEVRPHQLDYMFLGQKLPQNRPGRPAKKNNNKYESH